MKKKTEEQKEIEHEILRELWENNNKSWEQIIKDINDANKNEEAKIEKAIREMIIVNRIQENSNNYIPEIAPIAGKYSKQANNGKRILGQAMSRVPRKGNGKSHREISELSSNKGKNETTEDLDEEIRKVAIDEQSKRNIQIRGDANKIKKIIESEKRHPERKPN